MNLKYNRPRARSSISMGLAGFTLVELMVAVIVMSIIALGASVFVARSFSQLMKAKEMESAAMLASNTMEMFMGAATTNLPDALVTSSDVLWAVLDPDTMKWDDSKGTRYGFKGFQSPVADRGVVSYTRPETMTTATIPNYPAEVVTMDDQNYFIVTRLERNQRSVFSQTYYFYEVVVYVAWERGWFVVRSRREA